MLKNKKIIIVGDSAFAEIAYEYFTYDSCYEVVAFAVEEAYLTKSMLFGIPVISVEKIKQFYEPANVYFFVAIVYTQLNRLRTRLYNTFKDLGYKPASYISKNAFVWPNVKIGEHCFIFENNTLQPFVTVANNIILWSGNHIGHHSLIEDNCFIASHVVISGYCSIGKNSFLGVNATISNNVKIGEDNWIGPAVTVTKNTKPDVLFKSSNVINPSTISTRNFFKVQS